LTGDFHPTFDASSSLVQHGEQSINKEIEMATFADIQKIFEDAVGDARLPTHGRFWQTTRDQFVDIKMFDQCPIIVKWSGKDSPLVQILRADIDCFGEAYPKMPEGLADIPEDKIAIISQWIDDKAPE